MRSSVCLAALGDNASDPQGGREAVSEVEAELDFLGLSATTTVSTDASPSKARVKPALPEETFEAAVKIGPESPVNKTPAAVGTDGGDLVHLDFLGIGLLDSQAPSPSAAEKVPEQTDEDSVEALLGLQLDKPSNKGRAPMPF